MADLSREGVDSFWREYPEPKVCEMISAMESTKDWTLDEDKAVEAQLVMLGERLDQVVMESLDEEKIAEIIMSLKLGRMLRLLQILNEAYPWFTVALLSRARVATQDPNNIFNILLTRNLTFERSCLLSKIYDPNRLRRLNEALN